MGKSHGSPGRERKVDFIEGLGSFLTEKSSRVLINDYTLRLAGKRSSAQHKLLINWVFAWQGKPYKGGRFFVVYKT